MWKFMQLEYSARVINEISFSNSFAVDFGTYILAVYILATIDIWISNFFDTITDSYRSSVFNVDYEKILSYCFKNIVYDILDVPIKWKVLNPINAMI